MGDGLFDLKRICMRPAHCPVCGSPNQCRLETGEAYKGPCWCERPVLLQRSLERLMENLPESRCLCPACLEAIAADPDVSWDELVERNSPRVPEPPAPLQEGDFYLEGANMVFTAQYHLRRGSCCGSGCRHCPYPAKES